MTDSRIIYLYSDRSADAYNLQKHVGRKTITHRHIYNVEPGSPSALVQDAIKNRCDYIVHLFDRMNVATLSEGQLKVDDKRFSGKVIACCTDEAAYNFFVGRVSEFPSTMWAFDLSHVAELIHSRVSPQLSGESLEAIE